MQFSPFCSKPTDSETKSWVVPHQPLLGLRALNLLLRGSSTPPMAPQVSYCSTKHRQASLIANDQTGPFCLAISSFESETFSSQASCEGGALKNQHNP